MRVVFFIGPGVCRAGKGGSSLFTGGPEGVAIQLKKPLNKEQIVQGSDTTAAQ